MSFDLNQVEVDKADTSADLVPEISVEGREVPVEVTYALSSNTYGLWIIKASHGKIPAMLEGQYTAHASALSAIEVYKSAKINGTLKGLAPRKVDNEADKLRKDLAEAKQLIAALVAQNAAQQVAAPVVAAEVTEEA